MHIFVIGQVLHPRVFGGSVPVLHTFRNGNHHPGLQFYGFLAPFLIPTATSDADEYLHGLMMNVPVVTATRLEGDIQ